MPRKAFPLRDRIESKIIYDTTEVGCWFWGGTMANNGYGVICINKEKGNRYAHIVSYEHHIGMVPEGLQLDHLCRNRSCVNPYHLEPVTGHENLRRSPFYPRFKPPRTHCTKGHPYSGYNLVTVKYKGITKRRCRKCACYWVRDWAQRQRNSVRTKEN